MKTGHDYPSGTYQWHGTYHVRCKNSSLKIVENGHVVYLPNKKIFLFDKNGKCISPPRHHFSVIIGETAVFCKV